MTSMKGGMRSWAKETKKPNAEKYGKERTEPNDLARKKHEKRINKTSTSSLNSAAN
jgi:hypothetical protein